MLKGRGPWSLWNRQIDHFRRRYSPAIEAHFPFLLWLIPTVELFPCTQKFLPGDRVQTTAVDALEALIEASYSRDRRGAVVRANRCLRQMRQLLRQAARGISGLPA